MREKDQQATLGVTISRQGEFMHLSGTMDEFADFSPLLGERPPLKLALTRIRAINSHGVRKWLQFLSAWGAAPLELHGCPPCFVDMMVMVINAAAADGSTKRVRSVQVPYRCHTCSQEVLATIPISDSLCKDGSISLPDRSCKECGSPLEVTVEPAEYFSFLSP